MMDEYKKSRNQQRSLPNQKDIERALKKRKINEKIKISPEKADVQRKIEIKRNSG